MKDILTITKITSTHVEHTVEWGYLPRPFLSNYNEHHDIFCGKGGTLWNGYELKFDLK